MNSGRAVSFRLEYQHQDENNDDKYQKEDALPSTGVSLIPVEKMREKATISLESCGTKITGDNTGDHALCSYVKFFHSILHLHCGLLDIVLHAV